MGIDKHNSFIYEAIEQAKLAKNKNEIPIGAIITLNSNIIAKEFNTIVSNNDPTSHAEVKAIKSAAKVINNYRLTECVLYTTLEPCIMCLGAILNARIKTLVYCCKDIKFPSLNIYKNNLSNFNHKLEVIIIENEYYKNMLQSFFKKLR